MGCGRAGAGEQTEGGRESDESGRSESDESRDREAQPLRRPRKEGDPTTGCACHVKLRRARAVT